MLLVPVGIINERHEPPVFYGVERPLVDTVIIPTTWFDAGAGVHGEVGRGWRYRAYVMAPLNAAEFNADEGIRDGRQKGSEANAGRVALTGRVEYVGIRGLTVGVSFWSGRVRLRVPAALRRPGPLVEADARYSRDRVELRGQFAQVSIDNADQLNDAIARSIGVIPNIARDAARLLPRRRLPDRRGRAVRRPRRVHALREFRHAVPHARRLRAAQGVRSRRLGDRRHSGPIRTWPSRSITSILRNRSPSAAPNSFNVGLGWWF